ncbi:Isochorismatase domain-containing protein [Fusarium pseudocircinatum]|uniref:Isochorismatase domain-containing protein n=2 Tax=Fusarium fujikuroi species complex TaxID=171627 RepID=A0A8H5P2U6_9HYPO|nr:Isochorismatase domain-containing protein [Fusarium pseudocircinatum]
MSSPAQNELRFKTPNQEWCGIAFAIFKKSFAMSFTNSIACMAAPSSFDATQLINLSVLTTQKLLKFANTLSVPVVTTTQTSAKLGPTVSALAQLLPSSPHDKTRFSMSIPSITVDLPQGSEIALVGIESHICITQTALDLRDAGHKVYVIADGVSSCNPREVDIALDRLRAEPGITVTSSESWMYECVGDSQHPAFKGLIGVVKESIADTRKVWQALPPGSKI